MGVGQYKGQHLYVSRGLYTHHGLGDGHDGVIHYSEPTDGPAKGFIRRTSLSQFARDGDIKLREYQSRRFSPDEAVKRAESRLGENGYSLWGNNCEHFVSWCITGDHNSKQVDRGATIVSILLTQGARKGATAVVASQGAVAGLSGSGIMSGLATTGGVVGGGAVAGIGILGGVGGAGMASALNNTVFKDDPNVPSEERKARSIARKSTYGGAAVATAGGIAAVSAAGATTGLSATGITSGLAAVGGTVGGGMAAGTALVAAAPVVAAAGVGYGAYKLWKGFASGQRDLIGDRKETGINSRDSRQRRSQIPAGFRPKKPRVHSI